jgi:hypothetical protein
MKPTRYIPVLCAALLPLVIAACANGCKKESDELPPAPSAVTPPPVASPAAVAPIVPEEPDAGADAADAEADVKKATGGGGDPTGVRKCCQALAQNANSAPPEQKAYYMSAAAACNGMINSPQGRQALASLRGLLMGASMPAACQ